MLLQFSIGNFEVFNEDVSLSCEANLHTKKLKSNVVCTPSGNALKTLAIYGPNNTGKTCLIEAVGAFRSVVLHEQKFNYTANLLTSSSVVKLGAEFLWKNVRYAYSFAFDTRTSQFTEERFSRIEIDEYRNRKEIVYFSRGVKQEPVSVDEKLLSILGFSSWDTILVYAIDTAGSPLLQEAKDILTDFGNSLIILSMEHLEPFRTIEILKDSTSKEAHQVVDLIRSADIDIDDFKYSDNFDIKFKTDDVRFEKAVKNSSKMMDQLRLISIHRGIALPSIVFDSNGTKKIVALAGYLIDALNNGNTLILDELDCGLHFKLTRAIVSLFNNLLNNSAQLIFTTHDVGLLDIKTLFRKDQIWFTDKDDERTYLYALTEFTAGEAGIRSDTDLYDRYCKGLLGALPDPSLIDVLLQKEAGDDE